jgi:hypothetical protein
LSFLEGKRKMMTTRTAEVDAKIELNETDLLDGYSAAEIFQSTEGLVRKQLHSSIPLLTNSVGDNF